MKLEELVTAHKNTTISLLRAEGCIFGLNLLKGKKSVKQSQIKELLQEHSSNQKQLEILLYKLEGAIQATQNANQESTESTSVETETIN
jgi:hypothetical protein